MSRRDPPLFQTTDAGLGERGKDSQMKCLLGSFLLMGTKTGEKYPGGFSAPGFRAEYLKFSRTSAFGVRDANPPPQPARCQVTTDRVPAVYLGFYLFCKLGKWFRVVQSDLESAIGFKQ